MRSSSYDSGFWILDSGLPAPRPRGQPRPTVRYPDNPRKQQSRIQNPESRISGRRSKTVTAEPAVWTRKHLLTLNELSRDELLYVLDTAQSFQEVSTRSIKKVPALRGR